MTQTRKTDRDYSWNTKVITIDLLDPSRQKKEKKN